MKRRFNPLPLIAFLATAAVAGLAAIFGINAHVVKSTEGLIVSPEKAKDLGADCIIVLGCKVRENGEPSDMLRDRLERGVELYRLGAAPKIIMSGDHGRKSYNEVGTMKHYAVDCGVPSSDVFMDHAGFSTYETVYRAKEVFGAKKVIIVTQRYHLSRALYIAKSLGLEAVGVDSDLETYRGQLRRDVREVLARCKDFLTSVIKPQPKYLGEAIPVSGDGDLTNDEYF